MAITVRSACEDDAAAMVAILEPIVARGADTIMTGPITMPRQRAFIRSFPDRGVFHVAIDADGDADGAIVGFQDVLPTSEEPALRHVGAISTFVAPFRQRRGVGQALMRATLAEARRREFRKIMATIRADNAPALRFYERAGFEHVGTAKRHARIGSRYVDEVIMEHWIA